MLIATYNHGHFISAVGQAQALIQKYPDVITLWNILGAAKLRLGLHEEASNAFITLFILPKSF